MGKPKRITFRVNGQPVPQPRPRVSTRGGFARAYVPARHPIHHYRRTVAESAKSAGVRTTEAAVKVRMVFSFARPLSHKTKKGLKKDAPSVPREDVDNLAKGVLDALTCVAWHDDRQVSTLVVRKMYAERGETVVSIWPLEQK